MALLPYLGAKVIAAYFDLRLAPTDNIQLLCPGSHLVESGPAHRGVLAFERITGVEPPYPSIARNPGWKRIYHETRRVPLPILTRPDRQPVPAPIIHEGYGEHFVGHFCGVLVGVLAQRYVPEPPRDPPDGG